MGDQRKAKAHLLDVLKAVPWRVAAWAAGRSGPQEQREASLARVRDAFWEMRGSEDLDHALQVLCHELRELLPAVDGCSVQVADEETGQWGSYQVSEQRVVCKLGPVPGPAVMRCWREQQPVYRRDLRRDDPHDEARGIWDEDVGYSPAVRSVVDVPFRGGTLAVNSRQPNAFSARDIETLQQTAVALSGGLTRLRDQQALEQLEALVDDANDIIYVHDLEGNFTRANAAAARRYGYTAEEILQLNVADLVDPEYLPVAKDKIGEKLTAGARSAPYELLTRTKEGVSLWVEVSTRRQEWEGRPPSIQGVARDITERKQAEVALRLQRDLSVALGATNDMGEALEAVLAAIVQIRGIDSGGVYLIDPESGALRMDHHTGLSAEFVAETARFAEDSDQARLIMAGEPVYRSHVAVAPVMTPGRQAEGLRALAVVPVRHGGRVVAALNAASHSEKEIPAHARQFLEAVAGQIGGVVARLQAEGQLQRAKVAAEAAHQDLAEKTRLLTAFQEIRRSVLTSLEPAQVVENLARAIITAGIFRSLMVALVDEEKGQVEVVESLAHRPEPDDGVEPARGDTAGLRYSLDDDNVTAETARTGQMQVIQGWDRRFDRRVDAPDRIPEDKVSYFIPVKQGDRVVAVLATGSTTAEKEEKLRRIEAMQPLLDQVAIILQHARLYRQLQASQEALHESQARYRSLVEAPPDMVVMLLDLAGSYLYVSPQIDAMTGLAPEDFHSDKEIGKHITHPDDFASADAAFQRVIEHGTVQKLELRCRHTDGSYRWVAEVIFPIRNDDGSVEAVQAVFHDISDRKRLEEQLRHSQKMEAVGQLAAGVAHNFNNLLQGISGSLELAQMEDELGAVAEHLQEAVGASNTGARMIRQLMLFSRTGAPPDFHVIDLTQTLETVVGMCRRTFDRKISLGVAASGRLTVFADEGQLELALLNLCLNARDALEAGQGPSWEIAITADRLVLGAEELRSQPDRRPGAYIRIQVRDNGAGMGEQTRQRVFEPFFTTKEPGQGTGLGLATTYTIVEDHAGWIECKSVLGQGTTFSVHVPAAAEAEGLEEREEAPASAGTETILVIDDEDVVRRSAALLLQHYGYKTLLAADGEEGLEVFQRERDRIDLVLLDLSLPKISGLEVLRRLRAAAPGVKVILFTGRAAASDAAAGADAILTKPVTSGELTRTLRGVLDA